MNCQSFVCDNSKTQGKISLKFFERGGPYGILFLIAECDRIALAHMNDPNLLLWNEAAREKEICKQLCLRILMNLMIPMSLMS